MTAEQKRRDLVEYRLQQSEESLDEATFLLSGGKSPRSIVNRIYYAMFYAVLALLVDEPYSSSKHSGVLGYFNKRFIKEGLLDESLGVAINRAYELRQRGDYREFLSLSRDQVEPLLPEARSFIDAAKTYLKAHYQHE